MQQLNGGHPPAGSERHCPGQDAHARAGHGGDDHKPLRGTGVEPLQQHHARGGVQWGHHCCRRDAHGARRVLLRHRSSPFACRWCQLDRPLFPAAMWASVHFPVSCAPPVACTNDSDLMLAGGSCRIPASVTGVIGFRPTTGCWPAADGIVPMTTTRDTVGGWRCPFVLHISYSADHIAHTLAEGKAKTCAVPCRALRF